MKTSWVLWSCIHNLTNDIKIMIVFILDFKENFELENEIEVVDFYQLICFLLQIEPQNNHEGSWDRIEDMLIISGSPGLPIFTFTHFIMICFTTVLMQF